MAAAAAAAGGGGAVGARAVFAGVDNFLGQLTNLGTALGNFAGAGGPLGGVNERLGEVSAGFGQFNAGIRATQLAVGTVGATVNTLTAPFRAVGSAVTTAASDVVEGSGKIAGALKDVADASTGLTEKGLLGVAGVGTALVGLAATAVTESARYERGMRDIQAVTRITVDELDTLDGAIRKVASRFPSQIGDIQAAARELGKAGVDVRELTSEIIQLALAAQNLSSGELTAEGAAEAIGSNMALFRRAFADSGDTVEQQARRIINAITGIANETRASIPEVVSAINKLGPNVAPLGGGIEETAALAGTVLLQGPRGQEAGTALANLIQRLEAPSREAGKILEKRNISLFTPEGVSRPPIDAIRDLQNTYGEAGRAVNGLTEAQALNELAEIAQTRVLRSLNLILETGVDDYEEFLRVIGRTDVIAQAAIQNQSLIRQLEVLRNNAQLAGIAFGEDFVRGLGQATTRLNDFIRDQDKAKGFGSVLGRGVAAAVTGEGIPDLRAGVNDSPIFGPSTLPTFDAIFGASEKIRENVLALTRDGANLGKTLGLIAFPEGLPGAIDAAGTAVSGLIRIADEVVKKFDEMAPEVVKRLQEITGASSFDELITNAQTFGKEIQAIFTGNGGEQSFKNLTDEATNFFKIIREEGEPTIKSIARLLRTVEDTAPAFLRAAETGVRVFATLTRAATEFLGVLLRIMAFDLNATGGAFNFLGTGVNQGRQGLSGNFTTVTPAMLADRARQRNETTASQQEEERTQVERQRSADARAGARAPSTALSTATTEITAQAMANIAAQQESVADTADGAGDAVADLGRHAGLTQGEFDNLARAEKEAAEAQKALEGAQKSLSSQMRTLDKDITDAGGAFDKTISGAQQRWLDGLDQIAESTADAVGRVRRTATEARTKALEGFNLQVERNGGFFVSLDEDNNLEVDFENLIEGTNTIFRRGQEDRKRDFQQGIEDRQRLRAIEQENDSTSAARHNEDRTRIEQQGQENLTRTRQIGIEDRERQRQIEIENDERARQRSQDRDVTLFTRSQEQSGVAFSAGQTAANTARLRAREDRRASQRLAEEMAKATTPEERTKLLTQFTESRKTTAENRADQDEDVKYAQQQQLALTKFRQAQEDALTRKRQELEDQNIAHKRELETAEIAHRRELDVDEIAFRRGLEVDMIRFRRELEDKETDRRRAVSRIEIAQRRADELEVLGFDRTQQQEAQLFSLTNERIPDLQRQLTQINQQENDQLQNIGENAARQLLRAGLTLRREVQAAGVTEVEQLRRLQAQFETQSQSLLARVPESRRAELQASINAQRQVLAAQVAIAEGRQGGRGAQVTSEADLATQAALGQLRAFVPDLSSIETIFGQQATANLVTTSLLATPQVDRLTRALEGLTTKIDKIAPGVHVDTVEQTIQQPATPQGAIIQIGTIGGTV